MKDGFKEERPRNLLETIIAVLVTGKGNNLSRITLLYNEVF